MKCPNCGYEQADGLTECQKCQIVFSKFGNAPARAQSAPAVQEAPKSPSKLPLVLIAVAVAIGGWFLIKNRSGQEEQTAPQGDAGAKKPLSNLQALQVIDKIAKDNAAQNMPSAPAAAQLTPDEELLQAVSDQYLPSVEAALDKGADPGLRDPYGYTMLMYCAAKGSAQVAKALVQRGADVNAQLPPFPAGVDQRRVQGTAPHYEGGTALMFAAGAGNSNIVKVLLEAGADPRMTDAKGKAAWQYAQGGGIYYLADELKKLSQ